MVHNLSLSLSHTLYEYHSIIAEIIIFLIYFFLILIALYLGLLALTLGWHLATSILFLTFAHFHLFNVLDIFIFSFICNIWYSCISIFYIYNIGHVDINIFVCEIYNNANDIILNNWRSIQKNDRPESIQKIKKLLAFFRLLSSASAISL